VVALAVGVKVGVSVATRVAMMGVSVRVVVAVGNDAWVGMVSGACETHPARMITPVVMLLNKTRRMGNRKLLCLVPLIQALVGYL